MFIVPCKYDGTLDGVLQKSPVRECIQSISELHPKEKIVLVDSDSGDKSYFEDLKKYKNLTILDCKNNNRVCGAFYEAYKNFPDEETYILVHDSLTFKKSIQNFIDSETECFSLMYFTEHVYNWASHDPYSWNILDNSDYERPMSGHVIGCFGPMFIVKNRIVKNMEKKGLFKSLRVENKTECAYWEKIFGEVFKQEGYCPTQYNIEGDFKSKVGQVGSGGLEYFVKLRLGRA